MPREIFVKAPALLGAVVVASLINGAVAAGLTDAENSLPQKPQQYAVHDNPPIRLIRMDFADLGAHACANSRAHADNANSEPRAPGDANAPPCRISDFN